LPAQEQRLSQEAEHLPFCSCFSSSFSFLFQLKQKTKNTGAHYEKRKENHRAMYLLGVAMANNHNFELLQNTSVMNNPPTAAGGKHHLLQITVFVLLLP
jgi:hypothetical protein